MQTRQSPAPSDLSWPTVRPTDFEELKVVTRHLIVDDEPMNVKVAEKYPMPMQIPAIDGCNAVRKVQEDGYCCPIIVLTGRGWNANVLGPRS